MFGNSTIENLLRSSSTITLKPDTDLDAFIEKANAEFQKLNLVNISLRLFPQSVRGLNLNKAFNRSEVHSQFIRVSALPFVGLDLFLSI